MTAHPTLEQDAEDRLLDVALEDVVRSGAHATAPVQPRSPRWLAAAILLLGAGVLLLIALRSPSPEEAPVQQPSWQQPDLPPAILVRGGEALAKTDRAATNLWCALLPKDMALLGEFQGLRRLLLEPDQDELDKAPSTVPWSMEPLLACRNLQSLTIGNLDRFDLSPFDVLAKLPELREFGLIGTRHLVDAEFAAALQKLPLRSLSLLATGLNAAGFTALCGMPYLERLMLRDCLHLDHCDLRQLQHLKKLRSLSLRGVGGRKASALSKTCPLPDEPKIAAPQDLPGAMRTGFRMPGELSLQITPEVMRAIATLPLLRELDLQNSVVDDAVMAALPMKLEALDLGETIDLTPVAISSVAKLPNLWRFGFSDGSTESLRAGDSWEKAKQFLAPGHPTLEHMLKSQKTTQQAMLDFVRRRGFKQLAFRGTVTDAVHEALLAQTQLAECELVFLGHEAALDVGFTVAMPLLERLSITRAPDFDPAPLLKLEYLRVIKLQGAAAGVVAKVRKALPERVQVIESSGPE